jgi:hypothetical protein
MGVGGFASALLGLALVASVAVPRATAAEANLSAFQGSWLSGIPNCAEVYAEAGKGTSFRRPVNIFAPAFIVSGNRLRTPMASCRIKSATPKGDRQLLLLDCANVVAGGEVKVLMSPLPDGTLRRYLGDQDAVGTEYQRCSR